MKKNTQVEEDKPLMGCNTSLTLVIPTYNRPELLKRLLYYYSKKVTSFRFLILDSSRPEIVEDNERMVAGLGANFRHVAFPSSVGVASKLSQGIDLVETQYCAFCADDDLVFLDALELAREFLALNPSYVCADGIYLNFNQINNDVYIRSEYASRGIEAEHSGARIFRLFQKYESLFYGVFRTQDLKEIFSSVKKIPSLHFQELFQATAALIKGKTHRLAEFFACRQHCEPAEPNRENWQTFYWFASDSGEFIRHYRAYCDELWSFYQRVAPEPNMSKESFYRAMDLAHAVFFSTECPPIYFHSVLQNEWPEDLFIEPGLGNVLDDVKMTLGRTWENNLLAISSWFNSMAAAFSRCIEFKRFNGFKGLASLNAEVEKNCQIAWVCHPQSELCWLASVPRFRSAYLELCYYLEQA